MPLPNPQRIIINGPFWTAEATVIASPLAATGHNELHARRLPASARPRTWRQPRPAGNWLPWS
jgi:hypothetical protein